MHNDKPAISSSKRNIISLTLTILVLWLVLASGNVNAITLGLSMASHTTSENTPFHFTAIIDLHDTDFLFENSTMTLTIKDSTSTVATCTFNITGELLSACANLEITDVDITLGSKATQWGFGYGYTAGGTQGINQTAQGFGYGSSLGIGQDSYASIATDGELKYAFVWDAPGVNQDKTYTIEYMATVNGGKTTTFSMENPQTITVTNSASSSSSSSQNDQTNTESTNDGEIVYEPSHTRTFQFLKDKQNISYNFSVTDLPVISVQFQMNATLGYTTLTFRRLLEPPGSMTSQLLRNPRERIYAIMDISHNKRLLGKIAGQTRLTFRIDREWLQTQGIGADAVQLYEQDANGWTGRPLAYLRTDNKYDYYQGTITELVPLALTGIGTAARGAPPPVAVEDDIILPITNETAVTITPAAYSEPQASTRKISPLILLIGILVIISAVMATVFYYRRVKRIR